MAAQTQLVSIEAPDLAKQIAKLQQFDVIAAKHIRQAQQESLNLLRPAWQTVAPSLTGAYRESIVSKVTSVVGLRSRGIVSTPMNRGGFPYPSALEMAGTIRKSSNPHRGKVRAMLKAETGAIKQRFLQALERIVNELAVK